MLNAEGLLRIATRASRLALAQARLVAEALPVPAELATFTTRGDRARGRLSAVGGKGLFTAELEAALRRRAVQLAVHSAKDLPARIDDDLAIAAVPRREDPRDALVSPSGAELAELPRQARVGTSSLRRAVQLRALREDLRPAPVRGNVDSRIRKLREGQFDALIVAVAGLKRLGVIEELAGMVRPLGAEQFVPAAGQGALAVECLASDAAVRAALEVINDADSAAALSAERQVVRALGATCRSALGVHVWREGRHWRALGMAADPAGASILRRSAEAATAPEAAEKLTRCLIGGGAEAMLAWK